jgi:Fe-S cluster biogenesis protein NfuA
MFFKTAVDAYCSPLAKALFMINGVKHVFLATDYVTVTKDENAFWELMQVEIINAIRTFYKSNRKVLTYDVQPTPETHEQEEDDEVVAAIKELLDTRIRPMVQEDGGDILFHKFEDGVVYLKLQGSCTGCPSSVDTLKGGVENMLMHYIPEVEEVRQVTDDEIEQVSLEQFAKTEKQIKEREKHAKNLERAAGRQLRKEEEQEELQKKKERQDYYELVENEKERLRDYHSDEHWR